MFWFYWIILYVKVYNVLLLFIKLRLFFYNLNNEFKYILYMKLMVRCLNFVYKYVEV